MQASSSSSTFLQVDPKRCVYVGNIPYAATKQQLIEVLRKVGLVKDFRLISDEETGQPKGYGFCEFADASTARSAVRNLKECDFHGRPLRIEAADSPQHSAKFANMLKSLPPPPQQPKPSPPPKPSASSSTIRVTQSAPLTAKKVTNNTKPLGSVPSLIDNKRKTKQDISSYVSNLGQDQMLTILSEMKAFAAKDRAGARQLLIESPQLAEMLLQIQLAFGLVKDNQIKLLYKEHKKQQGRPTRKAAGMRTTVQHPVTRPPAMQHSVAPFSQAGANNNWYGGNAGAPAMQHPSNTSAASSTIGGESQLINGMHPSRIARMSVPANKSNRALRLNNPTPKQLAEQKMIQKLLSMTPEAIARLAPEVQKRVKKAQKLARRQ
mmetsp:Transcript_1109/g.1527  ORF Transcript_1109/g.1527 Transcript_1109/m.1527 type:complete len:379 (-) Transcript_1109:180-1316(-)